MENFEFLNPVKILFGKGKIAKINDEVPAGARVLVTYGGGSIKKNGVYDQVMANLPGRTVLEFGGIEANPVYETLMKAAEVVRGEKIDFILAVGGGSVLDGTKFIAAAARYEDGDPWDIYTKHTPVPALTVPFGTVLTLPATGSEMNPVAVITRASTKEKLPSAIAYAKFSVIDPEVTYSLPTRQVSNGIVDAFAHVLEQYLTYPVNAPLQDRIAESILLTLIEVAPAALENPPVYEARATLCWCATMALNGLIAQGVPQDWSTHMIGHEMTALSGLDHARTLAITYPGTMAACRKNKHAKLLQYAERIWNIREGSEEQRIDKAIAATRSFFEGVGVKSHFKDYDLPASLAGTIAKRLDDRGWNQLGERHDIGPKEVEEILSYSM
jgi:NADP-dependent alcohol dehydrogenase